MVRRNLLIDDSLPRHKLLSGFVTVGGYEFTSAYDGESGIGAAVGQTPRRILLDVQMPNMDAMEICSRLKNDSRTKSIPVILLTAAKTLGEKRKALNVGAVDYVMKPSTLRNWLLGGARPLALRPRFELKTAQSLSQGCGTERALIDIWSCYCRWYHEPVNPYRAF